MARFIERTYRAGQKVTATSIARNVGNLQVEGFGYPLNLDEDGDSQTPYVILDTNGESRLLTPVYTINTATGDLHYLRKIHFPYNYHPGTDSDCWFDKSSICIGGMILCNTNYYSWFLSNRSR